MSVLIRDMEMPKNCAECPVNLYVCQRGYEYLLEHTELYDRRADDCPISYVPADVVPVRHGRWMDMGDFISCSECNVTRMKEFLCDYGVARRLDVRTNYCPNCGARMDKEGDIGWIPVTERLPSEEGFTLIFTAHGHAGVCYFTNGWWGGYDKDGITHWMPLPEPPKEE